jgi:hypothetical protein
MLESDGYIFIHAQALRIDKVGSTVIRGIRVVLVLAYTPITVAPHEVRCLSK